MSGRILAICGMVYLIVCGVVACLWDFVYHVNLPFFSNLVVGFLTIIGAFLLGYWLYERDRIKRQNEIIRREKELKQRVISTLDSFKKALLPWLFHFANELSGHFSLYDEGRIYTGKYKDDIPKLEDIFGIGSTDGRTGKRLRGTDEADSINKEVCERPLSPQDLYHSLNYGLDVMRLIEREIKRFPQLLPNVDSEVADIVNLRELIEARFNEVRRWETKHEPQRVYIIDKSHSNLDIRSNLRTLGKVTLNIVIAIDKNIGRLNLEVRN